MGEIRNMSTAAKITVNIPHLNEPDRSDMVSWKSASVCLKFAHFDQLISGFETGVYIFSRKIVLCHLINQVKTL